MQKMDDKPVLVCRFQAVRRVLGKTGKLMDHFATWQLEDFYWEGKGVYNKLQVVVTI